MQRRDFLKVVGAGAAVIIVKPSLIEQTLYARDGSMYKSYAKVQLVNSDGDPIKASAMEQEVNYVFNYPFTGTSCILVNLPKKTVDEITLQNEFGVEYIWKGGVGENNTIVAFSGICPHQLTHINKQESFITYRKKGEKHEGTIVCDGHTTLYDPHRGCKVMKGKAQQPFASIVLEHADDDTLWAVGVLGPDKFHDYFKNFRREFKHQFGGKRRAKKKVTAKATVMLMNEYSEEVIQL